MKGIILFDGECNLCNKSVQYVIKRDPEGLFKFASQQSETGQQLMQSKEIPKYIDSIILIQDDQYYIESTAILKICRLLNGWWKLLYFLIVIPKPIRNMAYKLIAKSRHRWFKNQNYCMLPTPELKKRFL